MLEIYAIMRVLFYSMLYAIAAYSIFERINPNWVSTFWVGLGASCIAAFFEGVFFPNAIGLFDVEFILNGISFNPISLHHFSVDIDVIIGWFLITLLWSYLYRWFCRRSITSKTST